MAVSTAPDEKSAGLLPTSIVIPCLNEHDTLRTCVKKAEAALSRLGGGEIIVADNGSDDGSPELARSLGCRVVNVPIKGYGAALIHGISAAKFRYIVMGDADDSYDFREAVELVTRLSDGYDLCMGSRKNGKIMPGAMPWKNRYIGTPALTFIVNVVYGSKFTDVNSGLRAFTRAAFDRMQLESRGMEFASEMLVKASLLRLRVTEVPITLHKDGRSRPPHLRPWRDGWRHLKYILLFAPRVLYWFPASIMLATAAFLGFYLNLAPSGEPVYVFGRPLNDHWIIVESLLWLIGYQVSLTGLLVELYSNTHRLRRPSALLSFFVKHVNIERILGFASICFIGGVIFELGVIEQWAGSSFAALNAFRPAIIGLTLILTAMNTVFAGFFYSVLVDQYISQPAAAITEQGGQTSFEADPSLV